MTSSPSSSSAAAVVIDDDADVRALLTEILTSAGFTVIEVDNGLDGVDAVVSHQPVITTLDVTMPGIDGFETARRIREASDTYIVLITGLTDEADAVLGFGVGADDIVTKPFRPRELRARLLAMLRRPRGVAVPGFATAAPSIAAPPSTTDDLAISNGAAPAVPIIEGAVIRYAGLVLDRDAHTALVDGVEVVLTRTEFGLLAAILSSGRRVRSKADLFLELRDETYLDAARVSDADQRAVEAHITNLRRKLGESAAQPRFIETVRGVGYRTLAHPPAV